MDRSTLTAAYEFHRRHGRTPASRALGLARADAAAGKLRYPTDGEGWNPASPDGARYVDNLADAGLRLVGWADKIARIGHQGWCADDEGGEIHGVYRAVVVRLPGADGCARYLGGYKDPSTDGYVLDCSEIFTDDPGYTHHGATVVQVSAAHSADDFARIHAEREREYQEAWSAGQRYTDAREEVTRTAAERSQLRSDLRRTQVQARRAGIEAPASICAALREKIAELAAAEKRAAKLAEEILDRNWRGFESAFNDGAGAEVLS